MKAGIYFDMPNADYHGGEGVNKGLLDVVERSPLHALAVLTTANDNTDTSATAAQKIGTAFHTLLLEPDKFADQYVCEMTHAGAPHAIAERQVLVDLVDAMNADRLPKLATGGTKDEQAARIVAATCSGDEQRDGETLAYLLTQTGKELKAQLEALNVHRQGLLPTNGTMRELADILKANGYRHDIVLWSDVRNRWADENQGYTVLPADTYEQLLAMHKAVMAHPAAAALITGCEGVAEASVYATDPTTGELRRVRPDFWRKDGVVVDVKTALDASQEGFAKSLANYRYHVQDPYYQDTMQLAHDAGHFPDGWAAPKAFVFLTVEKAAPYAVACYVLDDDSREIGRQQYRKNLDTLAECKRTGKWPGYGDALQQIGVPGWYLNRNMHLIGAA